MTEDEYLDGVLGPRQGKAHLPKNANPKNKPRKKNPEDVFHIGVAKALHRTIAEAGCLSPDGVMWFSTELRNAGKSKVLPNGKTINLEGITRKNKGCVAGIPDITIIYQGRYHGIELKAGTNGLSKPQQDLHPDMRKAGAMIATAWHIEEIFTFLTAWKIPHRRVTF